LPGAQQAPGRLGGEPRLLDGWQVGNAPGGRFHVQRDPLRQPVEKGQERQLAVAWVEPAFSGLAPQAVSGRMAGRRIAELRESEPSGRHGGDIRRAPAAAVEV
jgi:hypothetical protein